MSKNGVELITCWRCCDGLQIISNRFARCRYWSAKYHW